MQARTILVICCAVGALPGWPAAAAPTGQGPAADAETQSRERKAVRGAAATAVAVESAELRALRDFEERSLRNPGAALSDPPDGLLEDPRESGPAGLPGRWLGSGDGPDLLRTPQVRRSPATAPPPESAFLASLERPEVPIRWDPRVLRYLDFFKTDPKGRAIMQRWLARAGRYRAIFDRALGREGVPRDLMYLAMVESGLEPTARSRVGAGGVWQFMPAVARAYGLEVSHWRDERQDPERSTEAAARFLKDLHARFGTWELAFAAYNAGYGAVLRSIRAYNTNDYWELVSHEAGLPWESSVYVPKILAAAIIGHNRAAFGFAEVTPDPPFEYDLVEAAPGTSFESIARSAGTTVDAIEALNPELVRRRLPPDRAASLVKIPRGTAAAFADASRRTQELVETVILRFGESLADVARSRNVSLSKLKKLNGVDDADDVRSGTAIVVPRETGNPESTDRAAEEDDEILVAVPDKTFAFPDRDRVFYRTRAGDTLDDIADVFRVTTAEVLEWNNVDPAANLQSGMVLQLFVPKTFDATGVLLLDPASVRVVVLGSEDFLGLLAARRGKQRLYYTARDGDTLQKVGRRYGLSAGDLARINQFSYATKLEPGQKIVVYSPTASTVRTSVQARTVVTTRARGPSPSAPRGGSATPGRGSAEKAGAGGAEPKGPGGKAMGAASAKSAGTGAAGSKAVGGRKPAAVASAGARKPAPGKPADGKGAGPARVSPAAKASPPKAAGPNSRPTRGGGSAPTRSAARP